MSLNFYANEEDREKEESLNNYWDIFVDYVMESPNLSDALNQMFTSAGVNSNDIDDLVKDIISKSEEKIGKTFKEIKMKYSNITEDDAIIICSYTCESKNPNFSPYRLLNTNMVSKNRKHGVQNISKYLFILLKSLRKLKRYYPDSKNKYLYRCIRHKVNLLIDPKDKTLVPYIEGNTKTFWGFTSTSPNIKMSYSFLDKQEEMKSGTRFTLTGNVWGYDITLFNYYDEEEVLLEPERKFIIDEAKPEVNEIIDIRCEILETPLVLFENSEPDSITIRYFIDDKCRENKSIKIFGKYFVSNNSTSFIFFSTSKLKILYEDKECKLKSEIDLKKIKSKKYLDIKLKGINELRDLSYMFYDCRTLFFLPNFSKLDTTKIKAMNNMFHGCSSLYSLPDISKWDTSNVTNMSSMFHGCSSLSSLPDISKWDTSNVTDMSNMFCGTRLDSLPDISEWNTSKVTKMNELFSFCGYLKSLPNISKWDTSQVTDMYRLFYCCKSLKSLPDISVWKTSKVTKMKSMFGNGTSVKLNNLPFFKRAKSELSSIPDISKWDTSKVTDMSKMFSQCYSLTSLPDLSKWDTSNVKNINHMFYACENLTSLPDISKWKTNKIKDMNHAFCHCKSLKSLPDISKWDTSKVTSMKYMFYNCESLSSFPNIYKWDVSKVDDFSGMLYGCKSSLSDSLLNNLSNWSNYLFEPDKGCLIF